MRIKHCTGVLPSVLVAVCGCASLDPKSDFERAAQHVEAAVGEAGIHQPDDEAIVAGRVADLLRDGLTIRDAVQMCLLNNPRLATELLKVGVARAEFVQSGLLSNPTLSFAPRWPDGGGISNLQFGLAQNIAELWQIPFRRKAAQRDLDRVILEAAREASLSALRARLAYYRVLGAERVAQLAQDNTGLTARLVELAIGRRDAGAGNAIDVNLARAQHAEAVLRARNASFDVVEARSSLVRLLGARMSPDRLVLVDALPELSEFLPSPDDLFQRACEGRLDLKASLLAVKAASARVDYEHSRVVKFLELGVSAERNAQWDKSRGRGGIGLEGSAEVPSDGLSSTASLVPQNGGFPSNEWVVGPSLGIDLPIFEQNQAQIAKAEYVRRQAEKLVQAIELDVFQEAHVACPRLKTAAGNARLYRDEIIPLRERVLALGEDAYRAGRTTLLLVVQAQQGLLDARAAYVDALRDHAAAIVEIERVAGCPYDALLPVPSQQPSANPETDEAIQPASIAAEVLP